MLAETPQNGERRNPEDEQASKSEGQGQVCGQGQSEGQSPCCNKGPERGPKEGPERGTKEGPAEEPELKAPKAPERGADADEEELEEARQGGKFGGEGAGPCKRSQHRRGGGVAGPGRPQQARQEQVVEPAPDPHERQPRGQGAAGEAGQESQGCSGDTVVPQFANFSETREEATTLKKVDKWLSEKEALSKWTEAELEAHCQSGRVQYRECPSTWGVWEYRDNQDFVKETSGRRSRNWSRGQEFHLEGDDEEEEGLEDFFALDVEKLLGLTEGKGKGKALAQPKGGKGKGKGGRKGKGGQQEENLLALQDGSVTEEKEKETDVEAYLGKVKKARDLLSCTSNNLEEALTKAKASSYCSAASQKDAKKTLADLEGLVQKTKGVLSSKRPCKKEAVVSLLQEAAASVNQAKELGKELLAMAAKTGSKSSKLKQSARAQWHP